MATATELKLNLVYHLQTPHIYIYIYILYYVYVYIYICVCVTISKSVDGPNMLPKLFKAKDDSCKSSYGLYGTVKGQGETR